MTSALQNVFAQVVLALFPPFALTTTTTDDDSSTTHIPNRPGFLIGLAGQALFNTL